MKEESGTDVSVRSRKRKANVAVVSTKETGGGGCPPPNLNWVPEWLLHSMYLLIRDQEWELLAEMVIITFTSFLFSVSVFLSLGCLVCFLGVWGLFYVSFCRIQMKKLPKLTRSENMWQSGRYIF